MNVIYVVPSIYLNSNVIEGHEITDDVEFMRLAQSVGDVYPNPRVFQHRFNNGDLDDSYILIKFKKL